MGRLGSCAPVKATGFKTTAIVALAAMLTNVRLCIVLSFAEESGGPPYHGLFCRRNRNLDVLSLRSSRVGRRLVSNSPVNTAG